VFKCLSTRPAGKPKIGWEEDVKADVKKMKVPNWKITVQDRIKWKGVVELYTSCSVKIEEVFKCTVPQINATCCELDSPALNN
jgi:hypothetical protein